MHFQHTFIVAAPLAEVVAFHRHPDSMSEITPPPMVIRMQSIPSSLYEGSVIAFTLWLGPLPVAWRARIEQITPISFVDRQVSGPFGRWVHLHTFLSVDRTRTQVVDRVEADLQRHWFWRLIGLAMWSGLPMLFAYRAWRTQRLVAQHQYADR